MSRKGIMALEELEERVDPETAVEAPAAEVEEAPEADLSFTEAPEAEAAEAADAAEEVEATTDAVEEGADTAETIEAVADKMEATLPEGGMDEGSAAALEVAVEHLLESAGFRKRKAFPALEAFGKVESRAEATRIALEDIREKAGKIWAQIVEAIKKAIAAVKSFFEHAFNAGQRYEARAEAIAKKASTMKTHATPADAKVKQSGHLAVAGKNVGGAEFVAAVKKHAGQAVLNEDRTAALKEAVAKMEEVAGSEGEAGVAGAVKGFMATVAHGDVHLEFGGATVKTAVSEDGSAKVHVEANHSAGGEVEALSVEQVGEVASAVAAHLKGYNERMGKAAKEADAAAHALIAKIEAAAKAAAGEDGKANVKAVAKMVKGAMSVTTGASVAIGKYDLTVCGAALDYAAGSLKQAQAETSQSEVPAAA